MYYFAYGSNMDAEQMRERCPDSELISVAVLQDYRLGFTIYSPTRKCGCADIVASPTDSVCGLLYRVSDSDLAALDRFEGHPVHYRRIAVTVETSRGPVSAESYEVVHKTDGLVPSAHYLGLIRNAAVLYNFPSAYQDFLSTVSVVDGTRETG